MSHRRFTRQGAVIDPTKLGMSACDLTKTTTSNTFSIDGANNVAIFVKATRGGAGYTAIKVTMDVSPDDGATSPTWYELDDVANATGAATQYISTRTVATALNYVFSIGEENDSPQLVGKKARINISSTAGAAGDVADVSVIVGFQA